MLGTFWSDVRYAVRSLAIGASASVFTVVDGFLFTPLPYEQPEELVTLWSENPPLGWERSDVNPADVWDLKARSTSLEDAAVFYEDGLNLTGDGPPELVTAVRMTPNTLALLGRGPAEGRDFLATELGPGKDGVVILQDGFWERRFARDPGVLGSTLTLDGRAFAVVGIMPADFRFLDELPDVFLPLDLDPATVERGGTSRKRWDVWRTERTWGARGARSRSWRCSSSASTRRRTKAGPTMSFPRTTSWSGRPRARLR